MKYILPVLILFISSYALVGQKTITTPAVVEETVVTDLSDFNAELELPGKITNTSNHPVEIKWRQSLWDQPFEWHAEISDRDNYYLANDNGFTDNDYIQSMTLAPGESFDLILYIYPNGRAGTATYAIDIIDAYNPLNVLETMVYYISVEHHGKEDVHSIQDVKLFPNPAREYFELTPNHLVAKITLYNSIGQRIKTFAAKSGEKYDITNIPNGLYLLEMADKKGKTLKTIRLLKRSLKA